MRTVICIAVLALAGCLQSSISGASNGSAGASSSGANGATGTTSAPTTASGSPSGSSNGGQPGTSTGNGFGGSSTGGSVTGSAFVTSGGFGGSGGISGTSGTLNGTTGGFRATGTNGGTGGRRRSDAGPCLPNLTQCTSSDDCCSGTCEDDCTEGEGEPCFLDGDCVSYSCTNGQCGCSSNDGAQSGFCGTSQDCCDLGECTFVVTDGYGYGLCCNGLGSNCQSPTDCCDSNCTNGQCQCQAVGGTCYPINECCSGICTNELCQSGPGGPCSTDTDCSNANCVNGTCGTCGNAGGVCSSQDECCADLTCASRVIETGGTELGSDDGGPACCGPTGVACQSGSSSCCGECDAGICDCVGPAGACAWDNACCAGGACMASEIGLECCQVNGQTCFSDYECCTYYCGPDSKCACVPDGGSWNSADLNEAACCNGAAATGFTCL